MPFARRLKTESRTFGSGGTRVQLLARTPPFAVPAYDETCLARFNSEWQVKPLSSNSIECRFSIRFSILPVSV